jgi:CheY-like chemotaxis protein
VLVVDDNELMRLLLATMLRKHGYEVTVAEDGRAAVEAAGSKVDLVLLDLTLPGMNGLDVCRHLRADPATAALPIIVMTGRVEPGDLRDAIMAGATEYLTKPFEELDLLAAIGRATRSVA